MPSRASTFVISVTPFTEDGTLDEEGLRAHFRRLRDSGIGVYIAGSGSSEGHTLSVAERDRVFDIALSELKERVPVRPMGCEPHTPDQMIEYVQTASRAGFDAVHIYPIDIGHGSKATQAEQRDYYEEVISQARIPVVISSHHSAGYLLAPDLVEHLITKFEHIIGMVCATSDSIYLADMVFRFGERIEMHCGGPAHGAYMLSLGATGFLSNEANLTPELAVATIRAFEAGDIAAFKARFRALIMLHEINKRFGGSSMRGMKPLLASFGLPGGHLRRPRLPIDAERIDSAFREIRALGIEELDQLAHA